MRTWPLYATLMMISANAHPQSWQHDETNSSYWTEVLICITTSDEPWRQIDRGTLRKWPRGEATAYRLLAGGITFLWWWERRPDGDRKYGDVSLTHFVTRHIDVPSKYRFELDPMPGTRLGYNITPQSISVKESGEITERFGPFTIASVIGSECPRK